MCRLVVTVSLKGHNPLFVLALDLLKIIEKSTTGTNADDLSYLRTVLEEAARRIEGNDRRLVLRKIGEVCGKHKTNLDKEAGTEL